MTDLAAIESFKQVLFTFGLLMPRMIVVFTILPFFGKLLSGQIRNSIVLGLLIIIYPMVAPTLLLGTLGMPEVIFIVVKEVFIGLLIGFLASMPFWAAEGMGYFIDNQRGATMASVMDPMTGSQTSLYGSMFVQLCAVIFFTSGGFLLFLGGLFESYRLWPVTSYFPVIQEGFALFFLEQVDLLMKFIVLFAAPIVIALFVAEFGLGLINRFAPQLNVFFLSMPIKSGIASFIIVLYVSVLVALYRDQFSEITVLFSFLTNLFAG